MPVILEHLKYADDSPLTTSQGTCGAKGDSLTLFIKIYLRKEELKMPLFCDFSPVVTLRLLSLFPPFPTALQIFETGFG